MNKTIIPVIWLAASVLIILLLIFLFNDHEIEFSHLDDEPVFFLGLIISLISGIILIPKNVSNQADWNSRAIYWLGLGINLIILLGFFCYAVDFEIFDMDEEICGFFYGAFAFIISGIILLINRRKYLLSLETSIYWLGICIALFIFFGISFYDNDIELFNINDDYSGFFFSSILTLIIGIILVVVYLRRQAKEAIAVFWSGCSAALLIALVIFFQENDIYFLDHDGESAGFYVATLFILASGIALIIWRFYKLRLAELILYWLGCSVILTIFLDTFYFTQKEVVMDEIILNEKTGIGLLLGAGISLISGIILFIFFRRNRITN